METRDYLGPRCRYCLEAFSRHQRLMKKNTPWPRSRPYFKCSKGPPGWLSLKTHTFDERDPEWER